MSKKKRLGSSLRDPRDSKQTAFLWMRREATLSLSFGVSRPIVREALRSLAALTLIDVGNGRRARVAIPDASVLGFVVDHSVYTEQVSIQQIYDVRRTVEMRTVALAALRRSPAESELIRRHAAAMRADFAKCRNS